MTQFHYLLRTGSASAVWRTEDGVSFEAAGHMEMSASDVLSSVAGGAIIAMPPHDGDSVELRVELDLTWISVAVPGAWAVMYWWVTRDHVASATPAQLYLPVLIGPIIFNVLIRCVSRALQDGSRRESMRRTRPLESDRAARAELRSHRIAPIGMSCILGVTARCTRHGSAREGGRVWSASSTCSGTRTPVAFSARATVSHSTYEQPWVRDKLFSGIRRGTITARPLHTGESYELSVGLHWIGWRSVFRHSCRLGIG